MKLAAGWKRVEPVSDAALAAALIGFGLYDVLGRGSSSSFPGSASGHVLFLILCAAPLVSRRRSPFLVLAVVMAAGLAWTYSLYSLDKQGPLEGFIALIVAVYTAAAYTAGRQATASAAVVAVGLATGLVTGVVGGEPAGDIVPFALWVLVAYAIGRLLRRRQVLASMLGARVSTLEREREEQARQAVADERARIARELHDVIAHSVSVMVVQAGAGERVLDEAPEQTRAALVSIRQTGSEALVEMRRLLGLLREQEHDLSFAPQPGIARLALLVEEVRSAGFATELEVEGEPKPLAPGIELSAYRIVQEALTNVRKHAGAASARVRVRYGAEQVMVEVVDDGSANVNGGAGSGHGLIGMQERAALYGGTLEAGPRSEGGFRVRATLPLQHQPS